MTRRIALLGLVLSTALLPLQPALASTVSLVHTSADVVLPLVSNALAQATSVQYELLADARGLAHTDLTTGIHAYGRLESDNVSRTALSMNAAVLYDGSRAQDIPDVYLRSFVDETGSRTFIGSNLFATLGMDTDASWIELDDTSSVPFADEAELGTNALSMIASDFALSDFAHFNFVFQGPTIDGVATYALPFTMNLSALTDMVGDDMGTTSMTVYGTLVVGAQDFLPRTLSFTVAEAGTPLATATLSMSKYNSPMTLTVPASFVLLSELGATEPAAE